MSHKGTKSERAYHKTRSSLLHSASPNLYLASPNLYLASPNLYLAKYKLYLVEGSRLHKVCWYSKNGLVAGQPRFYAALRGNGIGPTLLLPIGL